MQMLSQRLLFILFLETTDLVKLKKMSLGLPVSYSSNLVDFMCELWIKITRRNGAQLNRASLSTE